MRDLFGVSLRGVIVESRKILLVNEHSEKTWETPGGGIRHGESIENALKREILEETGYDVDIIKPLHVFNRNDYIHILFLVKLIDKIREPTDIGTKIKWFSKKEIGNLLKNNKADDHDIEVFKMFINGELE